METEASDPARDFNAAMRAAIDAYDWSTTPVGPKSSWPPILHTILSMMLDTHFPMLVMWGDELIQIYNQGYVPIFGDSHPRSLAQPAAQCWEHLWDEVGPMLRAVIERGENFFFENLLLRVARNNRLEDAYFTFSYSPIREGERVLGLICVVNETTAHVLRERETKERAEALAQLDRAKTNFFNNVSHEFRTPLTLMLGPLEDLVRTLPDFEHRERADLARRNAIRLQKLVNMLLDFSSAQSGMTRAMRDVVDVAQLTTDLASEFRSAFDRAGLTLNVTGEDRLLAPVDRPMYEKVVLNLLSNALKFTFEGGVVVSVERDGDWFVLRVSDSGVGIAEQHLPELFQRFSRVQGARSRTHEGSGIGLALVHELVALHGGSVEAQSSLGEGTTLIVRLPLDAAIDAGVTPADTSTLRREFLEEAYGFTPGPRAIDGSAPENAPRVLFADDNADLRMYLGRLLGSRYRVTFAVDGKDLVESARRELPDLVIADVMMPQLDGFAALERLRNDPATAAIPVILLSARAGEEAAADGLVRGADDYIIKPFVAADLIARIDALLRRSGSAIAPPVVRAQKEMALLSAAADRFIAATETKMVWDAVTRVLTPTFADWCYVFASHDGNGLAALSVRHQEPAKQDLAMLLLREFPHHLHDGTISATVLATRRSILLSHVSKEYIDNRDPRHAAIMHALDVHSSMAVPVLVDGEAVCAILAVRAENPASFDEQDRRFLETFAARTALAYENTKAQERERSIASTLQRALLPGALPALPGVRFSASYSPAAQESLVGGDWYDAFAIDARRVIVSIGDVVGHGLQAATVMASLRQAVRSFALENRDPGAILTSLNRLTVAEKPGTLATAYIASIDTQTLEVRVASAGHHAALVLGSEGRVERLPAQGLILGVDDGARYESIASTIEPGDLLVLFTDGFIENERNWISGEASFLKAVAAARNSADPATAVHLSLFGSNPPRDDAALITVFAEPALSDVQLELEAVPQSAALARTALRRFLSAAPLPEKRKFELLVAAGEAIVNTIEHAYESRAGTLRLRAAIEGSKLAIEIEDDGGTWDVEAIDRVQRGYGLPLMHSLSDSVDIARSAAGTCVRIIASLVRTPAERTSNHPSQPSSP